MSCFPGDSDSVDGRKPKIRECTDVFWLCLFLVFWILMILVACFAFVYGNPLRLTNGYDSFGNVCDSDDNDKFPYFNFSGSEMLGKKYLFFMDMNVQQSLRICVKECPDRDMHTLWDIEDFYNRTGSSLCRYDFDFNFLRQVNLSVISPLGPCPILPVYKSVPILNRCVPEVAKDASVYFLNESWNFVEELLGDLYRTWKWILYLTVFSAVLSVIMVSMLYVVAGFASWVIMFAVGAASVAGTAVLWWTYFDVKCKLDSLDPDQWLNEDINNEDAFKWYSIVASVVTLIILLLIFAMRKRVTFLVALFQEASNCLSELSCLYLQPIVSFLLLVTFYAFWISVVLSLATASYAESKPLKFTENPSALPHEGMRYDEGDPVANKNISINELMSFTTVQYFENKWLQYMLILYLIGLIWVSEFILACQHMVVASSVAKWYFNRHRKSSSFIVTSSIGNTICYHLGSVALGSLLITLLKLPRIVLTYLHNKFRRNKEESQCARCGLKCCSCCFYTLEKFIRYMNHNAYTVVAIQGINFCPSAYRAWKILVNNALRLATVNSVGDFILFLGKCFVAVTTTMIAVLIFKYDASLKFYAGPALIVFIFSFFVAHCVVSLYELVIDTLFLCICEDQQVNGNRGQWKTTLLANIEYKGVRRCPVPQPTEL